MTMRAVDGAQRPRILALGPSKFMSYVQNLVEHFRRAGADDVSRSTPRRLRLAFCTERVLPPHPGKAREIAVRRTKDQSVLDGKCGKMGILDKIRVHSRRGEEFSDYLAMALGGLRNPYSLGGEPVAVAPGPAARPTTRLQPAPSGGI